MKLERKFGIKSLLVAITIAALSFGWWNERTKARELEVAVEGYRRMILSQRQMLETSRADCLKQLNFRMAERDVAIGERQRMAAMYDLLKSEIDLRSAPRSE